MNDKRKIHIENIVKEETEKANSKLGFLNDITCVCLKKGLRSSEYIEIYEKVIRNIMQICDSRLKNSFANKRRYKEEIKKHLRMPHSRTKMKCINFLGPCLDNVSAPIIL